MTAKFLKTYLLAFVAFAFIFSVGTMVLVDSINDLSAFYRHTTVLIIFSFPAMIGLAAFAVAKIVNFKSPLYQFSIPAIVIDFVIALTFIVMAVIFVKINENATFGEVIRFSNKKFLLLLFVALLAAFPVILLRASLTNFKERIAGLDWDKLGGKFFLIFYLASLLFSVMSIIFAFFVYDRTIADAAHFNRTIYSATFCFTITVALSAFLSAAADFLGKHTKSISFLLMIVFLGVLLFGGFLYLLLSLDRSSSYNEYAVTYYNNRANYDYNYYPEEEYYGDGEYAGEEMYYISDYGGDEEFAYQGLDDDNKLSFLWNNPENDSSNVKAAIKFALREFDNVTFDYLPYSLNMLKASEYSRYMYDDKKGGPAYYQIFNYIYRNRTQLPVVTLAEAYWDRLTRDMPEKIYKKRKMDEFVHMFRWAYLQLYKDGHDEPYMNFYGVYNIMDNVGKSNLYEYYPLIRHFVNENELPYPMRNSEGEIYENLVVWVYSFWGRRYSDGNAAEVFQLLNMLYEHYSAAE